MGFAFLYCAERSFYSPDVITQALRSQCIAWYISCTVVVRGVLSLTPFLPPNVLKIWSMDEAQEGHHSSGFSALPVVHLLIFCALRVLILIDSFIKCKIALTQRFCMWSNTRWYHWWLSTCKFGAEVATVSKSWSFSILCSRISYLPTLKDKHTERGCVCIMDGAIEGLSFTALHATVYYSVVYGALPETPLYISTYRLMYGNLLTLVMTNSFIQTNDWWKSIKKKLVTKRTSTFVSQPTPTSAGTPPAAVFI